jgi:ABC-type antimicrobial peptide transport system permease subunit
MELYFKWKVYGLMMGFAILVGLIFMIIFANIWVGIHNYRVASRLKKKVRDIEKDKVQKEEISK